MPKASAPFRVLVVDDEAVIRELVRGMLDGDGVEVHCARDGETALRDVREFRPDLVLLDLVLPGMDGVTVCRLLKGDPSLTRVPVHALTARAKPAVCEAACRAGAESVIAKPFRGQDLIDLVSSLRGAARS